MKENDIVDRIIDQWRRERPDLDPSAKAVTARLVRAAAIAQDHFGSVFEPLGIKEGEFGALSSLRRIGEPYELSPTQMIDHLVITSGGLSLMLDRLERNGFVRRRPNPDDRRGVLVSLTEKGRETIDEAMTRHAAAEHRLVDGMSERDQRQLAKLLAEFMRLNEGSG